MQGFNEYYEQHMPVKIYYQNGIYNNVTSKTMKIVFNQKHTIQSSQKKSSNSALHIDVYTFTSTINLYVTLHKPIYRK